MTSAMEGSRVACLLHLLVFVSLLLATYAQTARQPPSITKPSEPDERYLPENAKVELDCEASGEPTPVYEWLRNDRVVGTDSSIRDVTFDYRKGKLVIASLTTDNEGVFYCKAKNSYQGHQAVSLSHKIEVRVGRVEKWITSTEITTVSKVEGEYAYLKCDDKLPFSYGPTQFKWYTVTDDVAGVQNQLPDTKKRFIDSTGTLHIAYVEPDDELDHAYYACALSNAVDRIIQLGSKKILKVTKKALSATKPRVEFPAAGETQTLTFERTKVAQLECFISGYPLPTITWSNDAGNIPLNDDRYSVLDQGRILKIKGLLESDEGNYYCTGANSEGSRRGTVNLNVTSTPIWVNPLESLTVVQDNDAILHCDSRAASGEDPPNEPEWFKNGSPLSLSLDPQKYELQDSKRKLVIKSVQKLTDTACFQCSVTNSVGYTFSDGCLNVILPIKIVKAPEPEQEVKKGERVDLTVVAQSDPLYDLSYKWIFNGEEYKDAKRPPHVIYDDESKLAYIDTTNFTDSQMEEIDGLYEIEVYHKFEKRVIKVDVTVADKPDVVPVTQAGFDYWIIGLIIGILLIIIVILIICCVICRRKMLEGDYAVDRKETAAGLDPERELKDSGFHDLSRADYDYLPDKKSPNDMDLDDNIPLGDDESFGSAEYGEEATAFNEDGSFIGVYSKGKKAGGPPGYQPAESNV